MSLHMDYTLSWLQAIQSLLILLSALQAIQSLLILLSAEAANATFTAFGSNHRSNKQSTGTWHKNTNHYTIWDEKQQ